MSRATLEWLFEKLILRQIVCLAQAKNDDDESEKIQQLNILTEVP